MTPRTLTLVDALDVVARMRPQDRACFDAMLGDTPDEAIAVGRWQTDGPAWALPDRSGRAQAIGGLSFQTPWLAVMWLVATPAMTPDMWRKLLRFTRTVLRNATDPQFSEYRHRIEVYVLDGWSEAERFAERLGFRYEGTRCAAGRGGEDVQMWAIAKGPRA